MFVYVCVYVWGFKFESQEDRNHNLYKAYKICSWAWQRLQYDEEFDWNCAVPHAAMAISQILTWLKLYCAPALALIAPCMRYANLAEAVLL